MREGLPRSGRIHVPRCAAEISLLAAVALVAPCGNDSPGPQCALMLPDGVSAATTVVGPFVCIRTPEALAHVGSLVTVSGYAAGADEVHVEIRGVDARQDQEVVLASLQVQVESSTVTSADGAVLGTWSAQLPLLPPAGVERRARIVAELAGDGTGSAASSEIAVDLDATR